MNIGLKGYWCINKTKWYNHIFKMAVFNVENGFPTVSGVNLDPMESIP